MSTAWVTLATNDGYAIGALVLAHSLRNLGTQHKLHVMYTSGVSPAIMDQLKAVFDDSNEVDVLNSKDEENLALIGRPELGVTFTKLHCWRLTQYEKAVFLDADTFFVQNADELFERPEFSAAPDIGWPDLFNTGVFVFVPSLETYRSLLNFALTFGSFDGGDQGLLNQYFHGWREQNASHRLPFTYNVTATAIYSYAAAVKRHADQIKIVHFLWKQKPWQHYSGSTTGVSFVSDHLKKWQEVYSSMVAQHLPASLRSAVCKSKTLEEIPAKVAAATGSTSTPSAATSSLGSGGSSGSSDAASRQEAWEHGQPDYEGEDAFANIQKAIDKSLE